jgi:hypothetical protein
MKMVVFQFANGDGMKIPGDCIDMQDEFIFAWNGEYVAAMVRRDIVNAVCISEKKE